MKFRTTLILMAAFLALLAAVLLFESRSRGKKASEEKLVDLSSDDIQKISLKKEDETIVFKKDDKGDWFIVEPLEAKADTYEVNRLAQDFSSLRIDRVIEPEGGDPAKYEIPKKELTLWVKDKEQPVKLFIGMENPLDKTLFAKKEDDPRIVLLASYLKSGLDKTVFDFRQKDVFTFETQEVKNIKLRAKDISWEAQKKEEDWFFLKPVSALARKTRVEDVLRALSSLRAKGFVSEQKQEADLEKHGLKEPEYTVILSFPSENKEMTFSLHKEGDKVYATTSLSPKIIEAESHVLTDIEKKVEDLREKQVVAFNTWEAAKVDVKKADVALVVVKGKDDKWFFESPDKGEADRSKVETFIRKIEGLEASEFIDLPAGLEEYGLAPPQGEVTIWTKRDETEKHVQVLVGRQDEEKKQVVVKNPRLDYLFRVDSSFLNEIPAKAEDWKPAPPEDKKEDKKKEEKK
ncbi:MAG: DUF4340 domain-containing protein [Clostridiales bacterium]|nr:DUF4340 domain-containing protein [Clostridiales bacterium]